MARPITTRRAYTVICLMFLDIKDRSIEKTLDLDAMAGIIPIINQGIDKLQIYENSGERNKIDRCPNLANW